MNFLDLVFAGIALYFLVRGLFRGFIIEVAGIAGVVAGFFLANKYHLQLAPDVNRILDTPKWSATISYLLIFIGSIILVSLLARLLSKMTPSTAVWLDKLAGAVVGVVKAGLICLVIFLVMSQYLPDSTLVNTSRSAPYLEEAANRLRPYMPDVDMYRIIDPDALQPDAPGDESDQASSPQG